MSESKRERDSGSVTALKTKADMRSTKLIPSMRRER